MIKIDLKFDLENKEKKDHLVCFVSNVC